MCRHIDFHFGIRTTTELQHIEIDFGRRTTTELQYKACRTMCVTHRSVSASRAARW